MPFFVDRSRGGQDRFLLWKVRLFAVGATLGLAGMFLEIRLMIWGAIGVLVMGFLLRFASGRGHLSPPDEPRDDEPPADEGPLDEPPEEDRA